MQSQFAHIQTLLDAFQQLFKSLASQYQIYIQAGTLPVLEKDGAYRNRAYVFSPPGTIGYQDKLFLTPFELETHLFKPANKINIFKTTLGNFAILICYDCEFPLLAKHLAAAGANLFLIPSCTEKMSGLTRISISAQARAIENQCYVAQSSLIGKTSWCDFIDINNGKSAIYCPADSGFPEEGILAEASLNTPMVIYADLFWDKLEHVKSNGEMQNFKDMQRDLTNLVQSIATITIG